MRYFTMSLSFMALVATSVAMAEEMIKPIQEIFEPAAPADASLYTKVAVVQWAPSGTAPITPDQSVIDSYKASVREALSVEIRDAARNNAQVVITPEFALVGYPDIPELPEEDDNFRSRDDIKGYVETVPGPSTQYFGALAKELGIYLHIGLAEVDATTNKYYNTVVAFSPTGEIVAKYRKMGLYKIEENYLSKGTEGVSYEAPFGRVGIIICSDVYHEQPIASYRPANVDVLALSTSWAAMNSGWSAFTSAARSARMYVLAANMPYFPDSGVINPDGSAQSHIRQTTHGTAYGYLPRKVMTKKRR